MKWPAAFIWAGRRPAGSPGRGLDDYADNQLLETAGLVTTGDAGKRYDRFRERVMFPILNQQGAVIAFGGRILGSRTTQKQAPRMARARNT